MRTIQCGNKSYRGHTVNKIYDQEGAGIRLGGGAVGQKKRQEAIAGLARESRGRQRPLPPAFLERTLTKENIWMRACGPFQFLSVSGGTVSGAMFHAPWFRTREGGNETCSREHTEYDCQKKFGTPKVSEEYFAIFFAIKCKSAIIVWNRRGRRRVKNQPPD